MKKTYFWQTALMAGALLFGFTACSNDDNEAQQQNNNEERTLVIALGSSNAGSMRTTQFSTAPTTTAENTISSVTIGVFNGETPIKIKTFNSSSTENGITTVWDETSSSNITITMATQGVVNGNTIVAIANPASTTVTALENATTLTAFKDIAIGARTLLTGSNTGTEEISTGLPMIGHGTIDGGAGTTSDPFKINSGISLYHMAAKVSIESYSTEFTGIYAGATFTPTLVYLDNVPEEQKCWYTPSTSTTYLSGATDAETEYLRSTSTLTSTKLGGGSDNIYFYTMPNGNDGTSGKATRLVVKGEFTPSGGSATTVYYPIYLDYNTADQSAASAADFGAYKSEIASYLTGGVRKPKLVYPNDWYKIALTIKAVGTTSATGDLDPQAVQVTVSAVDFNGLSQTATFQ